MDWKNRLNKRQYHFHDVAKYEKIWPKESKNIKEFRSQWGIYLPVIKWDNAMVTAFNIPKIDNQEQKLYFNITHTSKFLQGKLQKKLTKVSFSHSRSIGKGVRNYSREPP